MNRITLVRNRIVLFMNRVAIKLNRQYLAKNRQPLSPEFGTTEFQSAISRQLGFELPHHRGLWHLPDALPVVAKHPCFDLEDHLP